MQKIEQIKIVWESKIKHAKVIKSPKYNDSIETVSKLRWVKKLN